VRGKAIDWTPDLIERICGEVACGRSIRQISQEAWCPGEKSIYRQMATDNAFAAALTKARAQQQEYMADQCVELADTATAEDWQVVKLRIWARQWRAAKLAPKKYGDSKSIELSGVDGGAIRVDSNVTLTPAEAYERLLRGTE
jgi:hypothetical protein